ncbi:hypothetical protein, partial [Apilactobacillus kunkeei]|uniref:hypothetical protein n=1 Tax=Apilactobacillus kunkeei TaxID=148814 RepID=UPI001CDBEFF2
ATGSFNHIQDIHNNMLKATGSFNHIQDINNRMLKATGSFNHIQDIHNNMLKATGSFNHIQDILNKISSNNYGKIFSIDKNNLSDESQNIEINSTLFKKLSIDESKNLLSNKLESKNKEIINILSKYCWVLPKELTNDKTFYEIVYTNNNQEISSYLISFFNNNNYSMLDTYFKEIEQNILNMESQLSKEYADFASSIILSFKKDPSLSQLLIPALFVLLEFINSTGRKYKPFETDINNKKFYTNGAQKNKYKLKYSMYLVGTNIYLNFNDYKKSKPQNMNRNVIQHGKSNPKDFTIESFIKLSILCNTFSFETI